MQDIAGYKILQTFGGEQAGHTHKAAISPRLAISEKYVSLKIRKRNIPDEEFANLCKHLAKATHTGSEYLANIYEVGREKEHYYIASEYFSEGSLEKPATTLSRTDVLDAIGAACLGAHELHEVGIAHCSIQPKNIMLASPVKLAAVGTLSVLSPGQTLAGSDDTIPIEYQSPERVQGQPFSRENDIWALGATLHKTLTGDSIFPQLPDDSLLSTVRHILNTKPTMSDSLRNGERKIIEMAVLNEQEERYKTAAQMAEDIAKEALRQKEAGIT